MYCSRCSKSGLACACTVGQLQAHQVIMDAAKDERIAKLEAEAKRRFLDDFHSHPYVQGLERQHEHDKKLYTEQFERAEAAEAKVKDLEHKIAVTKAMSYKEQEFDDVVRVLQAAGLGVPVPEAIEKLIAENAKFHADHKD